MKRWSTIVFNVLCLVMLLGVTIFLLVRWNSLPDIVVTHYDFTGNADGFGKKSSLLTAPAMAWFFYIVTTVLSFFPSLWKTGVKVTEKNKAQVYSVILNMLNILKTIFVFILSYMTICSALEYRLPSWLTIAELVLVFGTVIISIVKLYKVR